MRIVGYMLWDREANKPWVATRRYGRAVRNLRVYSKIGVAEHYAEKYGCSVKTVLAYASDTDTEGKERAAGRPTHDKIAIAA